MAALLRKGRYCDVTVRVGHREFLAHRVVLSAHSRFFEALFDGGFKEQNAPVVDVKNLEPDIFERVIQYIYEGKCTMNTDMVEPVLAAASLLQIDLLVSDAASQLEQLLSPACCAHALVVAELHYLPQLAAKAEAMTVDHFLEVAADALLPFECMRKLLASDQLNVETEQEVFTTLSKWIKNQAIPLDEEKQLELFSFVRFPLLANTFIRMTLEQEAALSTLHGHQVVLSQFLRPIPITRKGKFTWSLSSMVNPRYQISNRRATALKVSDIEDVLINTTDVITGVERFRLRIDNIPPQSDIDALDMVGFVNNNSDMRSTGCCGLHIGAGIWTGNICVSGSYARSWNLRPVAKGDVLVLEADLGRKQFGVGIEGVGRALTTVKWRHAQGPVRLAVSFKNAGWAVTVLR